MKEELWTDGGGEDEAVDLHPETEGGGEGCGDGEEEGSHRGGEGGPGENQPPRESVQFLTDFIHFVKAVVFSFFFKTTRKYIPIFSIVFTFQCFSISCLMLITIHWIVLCFISKVQDKALCSPNRNIWNLMLQQSKIKLLIEALQYC